MKFEKITLTALLCAALLTGCGADSSGESSSKQSAQEESVQNSTAENSTAEKTEASSPETSTAASETTAPAKEATDPFVFCTKDGLEIPVNAPTSQFSELIATALSSFSAPSCAFEGISYTYEFNDFSIETYNDPETKEDRIYAVYLKETGETPAGLKFGMTAEQAKAIYGEPTSENEYYLLYHDDEKKVDLGIFFQEQSINSITYTLSTS